MKITAARRALEAVQSAPSPEDARCALADLFGVLAEGFDEADADLSAAWQDRGAGAPWRALARALDRWADKVREVRALGER